MLRPSAELENWVNETYGETPGYLDANGTEGLTLLTWSHRGIHFTVHLRRSTPVGAIVTFDTAKRPRAEDVIACLETPQFYCASHGWDVETTKSEMLLRFPNASIDAYGYRFDAVPKEQIPVISGDFPIARLVIGNVFSSQKLSGQPPASNGTESQVFQPWPGNWQAIEIDTQSCLNRQ